MRARLPYLRLAIYLLIVGVCGTIAGRELVFALFAQRTTGVVVAAGKSGGFAQRSQSYWADYAYVDADGGQHVGRARSFSLLPDGVVSWTVQRGDQVEVEFFPHAPEHSRLASAPAGCLCYGATAVFAAFVFAAEVAVRRRRRRRHAAVHAVAPAD